MPDSLKSAVLRPEKIVVKEKQAKQRKDVNAWYPN